MKKVITLDQAYDMVGNEDRELIHCQLNEHPKNLGFCYNDKTGLWESGDWYENEGAAELIVDDNGNIIRYDGYYFCMNENGDWY